MLYEPIYVLCLYDYPYDSLMTYDLMYLCVIMSIMSLCYLCISLSLDFVFSYVCEFY